MRMVKLRKLMSVAVLAVVCAGGGVLTAEIGCAGEGPGGKAVEGTAVKKSGDLALEQASVQTIESFGKLQMSEDQVARAKELIKGLNYTNMRVARVFATLPSMTAAGMLETLQRLQQARITYEHLTVLEHFATLPGVDAEACWKLFKKLEGLNFVSNRVAVAIGQAKNLHPSAMLGLIDRLSTLKEPELWALKAFLEVPGQTAESVDKGLSMIEKMTDKQCWATEKSCKIPGMTPDSSLQNISQILRLSNTDAWHARALFQVAGITPERSLYWITRYFVLSQDEQEAFFFAATPDDKTVLLKAFAEGSEDLIWKINNLHDITHPNGDEVGIRVLSSCPSGQLSELFNRLDAKTRARFGNEFSSSLGSRGAAIGVLRRATAAARVQAARDLTTANAYILLSRGSDFYDSSFREIVVPVLKERVDARVGGNLLAFLKVIDPQTAFVSDFIISLAQKGKLTVFFPPSAREQQQVLDLVAASAFQDENSLILFSATFMTLLDALQPESRSYLIAKMLTAIRDKNTVFSTQLRVILQYYIQEYPQLVSEVDKIRIRLMLSEYGTIPLEQYVKSPFVEWKSDGRLSSLSVFHSDDDGTQSFHSNCQTLMAHGYSPRVSRSFVLSQDSSAIARMKSLLGSPSQNLGHIHQLQVQSGLAVDWVKTINGLEVSHSVVVFHDAARQQELLRQFLKGGHEMFVQRGHSYWRKEQLLDPLRELLKSGAVTEADLMAKQRFLSLGSCGGIRVYSELALFFHNRVDILATVGTGKAIINDPYNHLLFDLVATRPHSLSWKQVSDQAELIFKHGMGEEYLQPGSLPAILHKIMDQKQIEKKKETPSAAQSPATVPSPPAAAVPAPSAESAPLPVRMGTDIN